MSQNAAKFIPLVLILAAGVSMAGDRPFANPGEPHAVVSGSIDRPGQHLVAVNITEVNGKRTTRHQGVWLKPGNYSINAKGAVVDLGRAGGLRRQAGRHTRREGNEIELQVEAGKVYWIALDTSADNRDEWKLVNWRIEGADD